MDGFQFVRASNREILLFGGVMDSGFFNDKIITWNLETNTCQTTETKEKNKVVMPLLMGNRNKLELLGYGT